MFSSVCRGFVFVQVLHCHCSVESNSDRKHILINHEVGGVQRMHSLHGLVADSNHEECPWKSLRIERKILGAHYWSTDPHIALPEHGLCHFSGVMVHPFMIDSCWIWTELGLHEVNGGGAAVDGGMHFYDLFDPLHKIWQTFSCQAPEGTTEGYGLWNDIVSITSIHKCDRNHCSLEGINFPGDKLLKADDSTGSREDGVDGMMWACSVPTFSSECSQKSATCCKKWPWSGGNSTYRKAWINM
uniref:Uncharacterized protein n=1 Tax=Arundo donax TaxID=35708 RepID=A0A0A9FFF9_ARUDO